MSTDIGLTIQQLLTHDPGLTLLRGNWDRAWQGISPAFHPRAMTICFAKDRKYLEKIISSNVDLSSVLVLVGEKAQSQIPDGIINAAMTKDPDELLLRLSDYFYHRQIETDNDLVDGRQMGTAVVHRNAHVAQNVFLGAHVKIGEGAVIHAGAVIMSHSIIGDHTVIYPNVTIYPRVTIGQHCRIHANSVIGADGFGYIFKRGEHKKIWHLGGVIVKDHVEIGACTTIDRGTFSDTVIGQGSIIDNLVQVAHNSRLGNAVVLCGQVGLSGSVEIGDYAVLGGKAAVAPEGNIGAQAQIAGMAGVTGDVPAGAQMAGHPARPLKEWLRSVAYLRKLTKASKE